MTAGTGLLDLTAEELLARFAVGRPTPGAGSAAALVGAVAASLVEAVCRRVIQPAGKPAADRVDAFRERASILLEESRGLSRRLRAAVDGDSAAFDRFWSHRRELLAVRRAGGEETAALADMAAALAEATAVPLAIAADCAALAALGLELFERGPRGARGESGAAVLAAVAGGEAAAYAAELNIFSSASLERFRPEVARIRQRLGEIRHAIGRPGPAGDNPLTNRNAHL